MDAVTLNMRGSSARKAYLIPNPKIRYKLGVLLLMAWDVLLLAGIFVLSLAMRKGLAPVVFSAAPAFEPEIKVYCWLIPLWTAVLAYNGGYSKRLTFWDEVHLVWKSTLFFSIGMFFVFFIGKIGLIFSRLFILIMAALCLLIYPLLRIHAKRALYQIGLLKRKIIILGTGEAGLKCLSIFRREKNLGYEVAGFIGESGAGGPRRIKGIKVHGFLEQAERYIKRCSIHDVLIACPELDKERLSGIINKIQRRAENTLYMPDLSGVAVLGTETRHFFKEQSLVIEFKNNLARPLNYFTKRVLDYIFGILLFLLLIVPVLLIMLIIRLTSGGPSLLRQERIGKDEKRFRCYKFRTMRVDADLVLPDVLARDAEAKLEWEKYRKLREDPRVTPVGRLLRRTSLDELPQIFNVLLGEMSLIGPRPYLVREWEFLKPYKDVILSVPPGATGLWQVSGRNNKTFKERLALDSWYVRNWSLWLDIVILLKTFYAVGKREGVS
jgi:Undecaprenyl-phosphate galactose phosphotransferase WbaP